MGEETAVNAVVGSIVWPCSQAQKAEVSVDESARGYALIAFAPNFPFLTSYLIGNYVLEDQYTKMLR